MRNWEKQIVKAIFGRISDMGASNILLARQLRLATIVNVLRSELISEEQAKDLLCANLTRGDDSTFYDDSELLHDPEALEKLSLEYEAEGGTPIFAPLCCPVIPCSIRLPQDLERVLFWHSKRQQWLSGVFYKMPEDDLWGSCFKISYTGRYVHTRDGTATHWTPMPPAPEGADA